MACWTEGAAGVVGRWGWMMGVVVCAVWVGLAGSSRRIGWAGGVVPLSVLGVAAGWVVRTTGSGEERSGVVGWSMAGGEWEVLRCRWMGGDGWRAAGGVAVGGGSALVGSRGWMVGALFVLVDWDMAGRGVWAGAVGSSEGIRWTNGVVSLLAACLAGG
ncbi:MAG: hypothetical protein ACRDZO_16550 [Egibacteraceae bacterium]